MEKLNNKVALITGGTKGIGYGIAVSLLQNGINVAITGRNEKTAKEAAERLNTSENNHGKAVGIEADVKD